MILHHKQHVIGRKTALAACVKLPSKREAMGDRNTLSREEAGLVLHRLVTEQVPVVVVFSAGDKSAKIRAGGVLNHFTQEAGLIISKSESKGLITTELSFTHA